MDQSVQGTEHMTNYNKISIRESSIYLDNGLKLSPAGATTTLNYANPPSTSYFMSCGPRLNRSIEGATKSLRCADQKYCQENCRNYKLQSSKCVISFENSKKGFSMETPWKAQQSLRATKATTMLTHKNLDKFSILQLNDATQESSDTTSLPYRKKKRDSCNTSLEKGSNTIGKNFLLSATPGVLSKEEAKSNHSYDISSHTRTSISCDRDSPIAYGVTASDSNLSGLAIRQSGDYLRLYTEIPDKNYPESYEPNQRELLHVSSAKTSTLTLRPQRSHIYDASTKLLSVTPHRVISVTSIEEASKNFGNSSKSDLVLHQENFLKSNISDRKEGSHYHHPSRNLKLRPIFKNLTRRISFRRSRSNGILKGKLKRSKISEVNTIGFLCQSLNEAQTFYQFGDERLLSAIDYNSHVFPHDIDDKKSIIVKRALQSLKTESLSKSETNLNFKNNIYVESDDKLDTAGGIFQDQRIVNKLAEEKFKLMLDEHNLMTGRHLNGCTIKNTKGKCIERTATEDVTQEIEGNIIQYVIKENQVNERKNNRRIDPNSIGYFAENSIIPETLTSQTTENVGRLSLLKQNPSSNSEVQLKSSQDADQNSTRIDEVTETIGSQNKLIVWFKDYFLRYLVKDSMPGHTDRKGFRSTMIMYDKRLEKSGSEIDSWKIPLQSDNDRNLKSYSSEVNISHRDSISDLSVESQSFFDALPSV
ncbi:hypothetical protein GcM1_249106 [Golovinomyces cichoracearum]|uniref:Uncharacterized protein n=1 Tax=Golovinomyces cichoracearum TaxID=62708 RepID=A0A420IBU3_9PEZI|nr:hypothetical protein GcM1_249106 [Golovinomyces cichoracearum]